MSTPSAQCPVCGAAAVTSGLPGLLFVGRRWYFCGPACRIAFKREPERWAEARPEAGLTDASAARPPPPARRVANPFRVRSGR